MPRMPRMTTAENISEIRVIRGQEKTTERLTADYADHADNSNRKKISAKSA